MLLSYSIIFGSIMETRFVGFWTCNFMGVHIQNSCTDICYNGMIYTMFYIVLPTTQDPVCNKLHDLHNVSDCFLLIIVRILVQIMQVATIFLHRSTKQIEAQDM